MSEDAYQASSLGLFASAARPVLVMMLIASAGAAMTRSGLLDANGRSALARMNFYVFGPCLVLNTITQAVSLASMPLLIVLLVNLSLAVIVGVAISYAVAPLVDTPNDMVGIFACVSTFGNVGNLPLVFASAMCRDTTTIFAHRLGAACEHTGIAYASYDILASCLWQFTIGMRMMRPTDGARRLPTHDAHRPELPSDAALPEAAAPPRPRRLPPSTVGDGRSSDRGEVRRAGGSASGADGDSAAARSGVPPSREEGRGQVSGSELRLSETFATSPRGRLVDRDPDGLRDRHAGVSGTVELGLAAARQHPPAGGSPRTGAECPSRLDSDGRRMPTTLQPEEIAGLRSPRAPFAGLGGGGGAPASPVGLGTSDAGSDDEGEALLGGGASPHRAAVADAPASPSRLRVFLAAVRSAKLNDVLPPPALAAVVGTVLGCIPLTKRMLYAPDAPLMFVASAINALGNGLIPAAITMLGALLARGPGAGKVPVKQVVAAVFCRLVLVPLVLNSGVIFLMYLGLFPAPDPIFALTALLANGSPTAVNIQTMAVLLGHGDMYVASCVFWCYLGAIFTLPTWTWISQKAIIAFA